jgi:4,5-DOPA dioxygenase extradiol
MTLPSLFVSHGAPDLPFSPIAARDFTRDLGRRYPDLRGIVIVSAHWEAARPTIGTAPQPETVHDFGGFDRKLHMLRYPAATAPGVIAALSDALTAAGIAHDRDPRRGYDHGVWVPLMLAFPAADVPVVQLSLERGADARTCYRLGQALAPLRAQGILVTGSGSLVHNLGRVGREGSPTPAWAQDFDDWFVAAALAGDTDRLLAFPAAPATARIAHPTPEHLMPAYVALGAGAGDPARVLHRSFSWGSLSMTALAFGDDPTPEPAAQA